MPSPETHVDSFSVAKVGQFAVQLEQPNDGDSVKLYKQMELEVDLKNWADTSNSKAVFWLSIVSTFFCCLICSPSIIVTIVAIVCAIKARAADSNGRKSEANEFFSLALNLNVAAFIIALVVLIIEISLLMKFLY